VLVGNVVSGLSTFPLAIEGALLQSLMCVIKFISTLI